MPFTFGAERNNFGTWQTHMIAYVPLFCDQCNRPMGLAVEWLARHIAQRADYCSDECRVLAEWYAPERR